MDMAGSSAWMRAGLAVQGQIATGDFCVDVDDTRDQPGCISEATVATDRRDPQHGWTTDPWAHGRNSRRGPPQAASRTNRNRSSLPASLGRRLKAGDGIIEIEAAVMRLQPSWCGEELVPSLETPAVARTCQAGCRTAVP